MCLATDDAVTSLVDVISIKDQVRLLKSLDAAQPYEDVRTAYLIVRALQALGFSDANKQVSMVLFGMYLPAHLLKNVSSWSVIVFSMFSY